MINARAETVETNPAYRSAFKQRRCLIPTDGFYEWKPGKPKQPYFIHRKDGEPFAFAGVWEQWGEKDVITSCAIIVTTANKTIEPIHDRMPAIISPSDYEQWLDPKEDINKMRELLKPFPDKELETYPVSLAVNSPKNDGPGLISKILPEITC